MDASNLKRQLTRNINVVKKAKETVDPILQDEDIDEAKVRTLREQQDYLKVAIEKITGHYETWEEKINTLKGNTKKEASEEFTAWDELNDPLGIETDASVLVQRIDTILSERKKARGSSNPTASSSAPPSTHAYPRLAPIKLPTFAGNRNEWTSFFDIFMANVDVQPIADVQKLTTLRSCLQGPPLSMIDAHGISNAAYKEALDALKDYYGKEEDVQVALMQRVLSLVPARSLEDIRSAINEMTALTRKMQAAKISDQSFLMLKLKTIFPQWLVTQILDKKEDATVEEFLKLAHNIVAKREQLAWLNHGSTSKVIPTQNRFQAIRATESPSRNAISNKPSQPCVFCGGAHWNDECRQYPTAKERLQRAKDSELCVKCLRKHSKQNPCNSGSCRHCGIAGHNKALCFQSKPALDSNGQSKGTNANAIPLGNHRGPKQASSFRNDVTITAVHEAPEIAGTFRPLETLIMGKHVKVANPEKAQGNNLHPLLVLDTGSSKNLIRLDLAKQLNLKLKRGPPLNLTTVLGHIKKSDSFTTSLRVFKPNNESMTIEFSTIDKICGPIRALANIPESIEELDNWNADKALITDTPDLLIGVKDYWRFKVHHTNKQMPNGLEVIESSIGPLICGDRVSSHGIPTRVSPILAAAEGSEHELSQLIDSLYSLEALGISDREENDIDKLVHKQFKEKIRFNEGRYEVNLPWKEAHPELPSNFYVAKHRLLAVYKRVSQDPELLKAYDECMQYQLQNGITEQVHNKDSVDGKTVHYLAHHPVIKQTSNTTKVRIVYDGSAKAKRGEPSLNECLYRGPVILPSLFGTIVRCRTYRYLISADAEKAFLQVGLAKEDRDATRFLWLKDCKRPPTNENIAVLRFRRVTFGLKSSPFLMVGALEFHLEKIGTDLAKELLENLYVDNIFIGAETLEEATSKCLESITIFKGAAMNLREFSSNLRGLADQLPSDKGAKSKKGKILGLQWDLETDQLSFDFPPIVTEEITKSKVLSIIASVFDPLGLLSPCLLQARKFFRESCEIKMSWDDKLPEELAQEWRSIMKSWDNARITVPRLTLPNHEVESIEIHTFADASEKAYGASSYLRFNGKDSSKCFLIASKSRLSPAKRKCNIHEKELLGILLATALTENIEDQLHKPVSRKVIWSDSKDALIWLDNGCKESNGFVNRRLETIRKRSIREFQHVPTQKNPADLVTRGLTPNELQSCKKWWHGPDFLKQEETAWPSFYRVNLDKASEQESETPFHSTGLMAAAKTSEETEQTSIIPWERYSSLSKLVSIAEACYKLANRYRKTKRFNTRFDALNWIYKEAQSLFSPTEEQIASLNLQKDAEGIYRCHGRLKHAILPKSAILPIFIPKKSTLCRLIIMHYHETCLHVGVSTTLAFIRRKFWIPQGRKTILDIIKANCMKCRPFFSKPFAAPEFPQLPEARTQKAMPFMHTGIDLYGPFKVKSSNETVKVFGAIFTCLTTRAIHLEYVADASAEQFLESFQRFVARRGFPQKIWSDNGTNFVLAARLIKQRFAPEENFIWQHITPRAPWRGGFYERLIKMIKDCIKRTIGRSKLTFHQFVTLLTQVESILNGRPLVQISDRLEETHLLRPVDFLRPNGNKIDNPTAGDPDDDPIRDPTYLPRKEKGTELRDLWEGQISRLDKFWALWEKQYLPALREQQRLRQSGNVVNRTPEIGEIVIIETEDTSRNEWPTGLIEELITSDDGNVRTVKIRCPNGTFKLRAVNQIFPLEISRESQLTSPLLQLTHNGLEKAGTMDDDVELDYEEDMDWTTMDNTKESEGPGAPSEVAKPAATPTLTSTEPHPIDSPALVYLSPNTHRQVEPHARCVGQEICQPILVREVLNISTEIGDRRISDLSTLTILIWCKNRLRKELWEPLAKRVISMTLSQVRQELVSPPENQPTTWISKRDVKEALQIWIDHCGEARDFLHKHRFQAIRGITGHVGHIQNVDPYIVFASAAQTLKRQIHFPDSIYICAQRLFIGFGNIDHYSANLSSTYVAKASSLATMIGMVQTFHFGPDVSRIVSVCDTEMLLSLDDGQACEKISQFIENIHGMRSDIRILWIIDGPNCHRSRQLYHRLQMYATHLDFLVTAAAHECSSAPLLDIIDKFLVI